MSQYDLLSTADHEDPGGPGDLGETRDPRGKPYTDKQLLWRVSNIVQDPNFDWDMRFKIPGIACTTVNQLADSGANRFTELLKERRDGPIALTLNK